MASGATDIGVIGCGGVAQMMHLPNVRDSSRARIAAVCDRAENVLEQVGEAFGVEQRYGSVEVFLERAAEQLDGVLVCTPSHTRIESALPVLERGIPVLVEKPLATTPENANALRDALTPGSVAMVGYMKRYHPVVEATYRSIEARDDVDIVEMYDVDPDHGRIIQEVHRPLAGEPPGSISPERRTRIENALGTESDRLIEAYSFQVEHACHDLNLLRGAFGEVTDIRNVEVFKRSRYLVATLRYGDVLCCLQSGTSDRKWFEEVLRVDTNESQIELAFDNPFKRDAPPTLTVTEGTETYSETVKRHSYTDSFALELDHFIDCIRGDASPRTSLADAAADIELLVEMFKQTPSLDG